MSVIIYKNKGVLGTFYLTFAVIFLLIALMVLKTGSYISPFAIAFVFFALFLDKFELDLANGQIVRKIFGITINKINIHKVKKYFLEYRWRSSGYFFTGTHIEIEISKNGKIICKRMTTNVDLSDIRKMFLKAKEINRSIKRSSVKLHSDILKKKVSSMYGFIFLAVVILLAIYMFINISK
jgi:hypothetical protein